MTSLKRFCGQMSCYLLGKFLTLTIRITDKRKTHELATRNTNFINVSKLMFGRGTRGSLDWPIHI